MSNIGDRIKMLRKELDLSQTVFGERWGVGLGVIRNIETSKTVPSDVQIDLICSVYSVNPIWLRTGEGDMFVEKTREEEIAEWAASLNDSGNDFKRRFIYALSRLDEAGWLTIEHFAQMLYEEQLAEEEQAKQKDGGN